MRPLVTLINDICNESTEDSAVREILPFLRSMASQDRSPAQVVLDVMFEILSRSHSGEYKGRDREALMEYARDQLCKIGIPVVAMGLSHAVIRQPR